MKTFKIGDMILLKEDYCEESKIFYKPHKIKALKYYQQTYGGIHELWYYTIEYGTGGHDVRINEVDYQKTIRMIRMMKLRQLGY